MSKTIQLETPALLVDESKLRRNCALMRDRLGKLGVGLRPHVKTAKSIDVIMLALDGKKGPITVSTLKEAEYFFSHGFTDILYAVCISPNKLARVASLKRAGCDIKVILDSADMAARLREFCRAEQVAIRALLEIDTDGHRSGIQPEEGALLECAALLHADRLLAGVITHAGGCYDARGDEAIRASARGEREGITRAANRLRAADIPCEIVSVGSTPTALFGESFEGITEVRAGVYVFFDLVLLGLGVCRVEDIALSVAASVIGHQPHKGWVITDAGWMAMSRDRGTASHAVDQGFGLVCDTAGVPIGDLIVTATNQEHGIVVSRSGRAIEPHEFPIGTQLRILPIHACATCAQHDEFVVLNEAGQVEKRWPRFNGW